MVHESRAETEQLAHRRQDVQILGRLRGALPVLAFLLVWELVVRAGLTSPVVFPAFSTVCAQTLALVLGGKLIPDLATTVLRASLGLTIATVAGIVVGVGMARLKWVNWFFRPIISVGFPMPTITLIPVFLLWFGIGHQSIILLVSLTCFFPIVTATARAAGGVGQAVQWSALAMGTRQRDLLWRVILPAAAPFILSGVRIALPLALITGFVAEMVGGGGGLGHTLMYGYRFLETATVFSVLLTILIVGYLMDRLLLWIRNALLPWEAAAERTGA